MAELAAFFAFTTVFMLWRWYVAMRKVFVLSKVVCAVMDNKLEIYRTDDGVRVEVKHNG